jgi:hypothetical protein
MSAERLPWRAERVAPRRVVPPTLALNVVAPASTLPVAGGWQRIVWPRVEAAAHSLVALRVPHPFAPGERYLREGYQSWSSPTLETLGAGTRRLPEPARPSFGRRHWLRRPPYDGDESCYVWRSETATAATGPGMGVWVADDEGLLLVREQPHDGVHPDAWFAPFRAGDSDIAARVGVAAPAARPHVGWSTWDAYGTGLTGAVLRDDVAFAARRLRGRIDVVGVDDGWQRSIGDWGPRDASMATALRATADAHELSLWWAPFVAEPGSELVRRRPEWLLRDGRGAPVVVLDRAPMWGAYALDLRRADVIEHLAITARRLAGYGARLFKLDFLYAADFAGDAQRARPAPDCALTGEQIYRRALAALRVPGVRLTACGAPLWPSLGLVDLMRVGPDVGGRWQVAARAGLEAASEGGTLANAWSAAREREWMHGRLWLNDPDSVFLCARELEPRWAAAWLRWVSERGLPLMLSDPLRELSAAQRSAWAAAVERWRAAP